MIEETKATKSLPKEFSIHLGINQLSSQDIFLAIPLCYICLKCSWLKYSLADQDILIECDQIKFILLGSHWLKLINSS